MILPILHLGSVLIATMHRQLDDEEAKIFQSELLEEVHRSEATGVIIDLSSVRVIDSFMSRILGEIVTGCIVMGAKPVYCGIPSEVAVTLVEMGRDLRGVDTATTLETALARLGVTLIIRPMETSKENA